MMVAVGREKYRAGIGAGRDREPELGRGEFLSDREIGDAEVDVPERGGGRQAGRARIGRGGEQLGNVERAGEHHKFTVALRPSVARAVRVDLEAVAIRIGEIDRGADAVVGQALDRVFCLSQTE